MTYFDPAVVVKPVDSLSEINYHGENNLKSAFSENKLNNDIKNDSSDK